MSTLSDFIQRHTKIDDQDPGNCADVVFFKVAVKDGPVIEDLLTAIAEHKGDFCDVDVFDGNEHNYLVLGGWLGSQELALRFIGLVTEMGMFDLLTPKTMLGNLISDDMVQQMAGMGMIAIQATSK